MSDTTASSDSRTEVFRYVRSPGCIGSMPADISRRDRRGAWDRSVATTDRGAGGGWVCGSSVGHDAVEVFAERCDVGRVHLIDGGRYLKELSQQSLALFLQ